MNRTTHEGLTGGPGPIGIVAWKYELLAVPFTGQWAASALPSRVQETHPDISSSPF